MAKVTAICQRYIRRYRREKPTLPFEATTIWEQSICVKVRVQPDALRPLVPVQFVLGIDRGDWDIQVLEPIDYYLGYFSAGPFFPGTTELDSVFYFRNTPYRRI